MKLIKATIANIEDYVRLQNEFTSANKSSESNVCNALAPIEDADRTHFEEIYREKLEQENTYFVFIENEGVLCGFFYGFYLDIPALFKPKKIGHFGTIFISESCRGKGFSTKIKESFLSWLKENGVNACHINVVTSNETAIAIYKKWGFKTNEKILTKKL